MSKPRRMLLSLNSGWATGSLETKTGKPGFTYTKWSAVINDTITSTLKRHDESDREKTNSEDTETQWKAKLPGRKLLW